MRIKNIAVSALIIAAIITFITFLETAYLTFQKINPFAVSAALIVVAIGIAWFKKTTLK